MHALTFFILCITLKPLSLLLPVAVSCFRVFGNQWALDTTNAKWYLVQPKSRHIRQRKIPLYRQFWRITLKHVFLKWQKFKQYENFWNALYALLQIWLWGWKGNNKTMFGLCVLQCFSFWWPFCKHKSTHRYTDIHMRCRFALISFAICPPSKCW